MCLASQSPSDVAICWNIVNMFDESASSKWRICADNTIKFEITALTNVFFLCEINWAIIQGGNQMTWPFPLEFHYNQGWYNGCADIPRGDIVSGWIGGWDDQDGLVDSSWFNIFKPFTIRYDDCSLTVSGAPTPNLTTTTTADVTTTTTAPVTTTIQPVPETFSISGSVTGDIKNNVSIMLSGTATETVITDLEGYYEFADLASGNYLITPEKEEYSFEPPNYVIPNLNGDLYDMIFISTRIKSPLPCVAETIYGEDSVEVEVLRHVRDNILTKTPKGREIIKLYYQYQI